MKMIVSNLGPVAVTMDGSQPSFRSYTGGKGAWNVCNVIAFAGVYNEPRCGSTLGHSMLLVGYGTDEKEGDYWLLKNRSVTLPIVRQTVLESCWSKKRLENFLIL